MHSDVRNRIDQNGVEQKGNQDVRLGQKKNRVFRKKDPEKSARGTSGRVNKCGG